MVHQLCKSNKSFNRKTYEMLTLNHTICVEYTCYICLHACILYICVCMYLESPELHEILDELCEKSF